jgi:tRNA dimethylallyltransferase
MPAAAPIPLLFGPTASGKTDLIACLAALPGLAALGYAGVEVVSADSMQVYRGLDIGTAKPSAGLLAAVPHHLIDIRDPDRQYSVGDFVRDAADAVDDIAARGRLPLVSGGTAFYLRNLLLGLPEVPPADQAVRDRLRAEFDERGAAPLAAELAAADPVTAGRIHGNDHYRLLRALEVFRLTGRPLSSFAENSPPPGRRYLTVGLRRDRPELYARIDARTAAMFSAGFEAEVDRLVAQGYGPGDPGMKAIGYREWFGPDGRRIRDAAAVEAAVAQDSRRYAKRQITFFAGLPDVLWLDASRPAADSAAAFLAALREAS